MAAAAVERRRYDEIWPGVVRDDLVRRFEVGSDENYDVVDLSSDTPTRNTCLPAARLRCTFSRRQVPVRTSQEIGERNRNVLSDVEDHTCECAW